MLSLPMFFVYFVSIPGFPFLWAFFSAGIHFLRPRLDRRSVSGLWCDIQQNRIANSHTLDHSCDREVRLKYFIVAFVNTLIWPQQFVANKVLYPREQHN